MQKNKNGKQILVMEQTNCVWSYFSFLTTRIQLLLIKPKIARQIQRKSVNSDNSPANPWAKFIATQAIQSTSPTNDRNRSFQ